MEEILTQLRQGGTRALILAVAGQALQKAVLEGRARPSLEPGQHKERNSVCELERREAGEGQLESAIRGHSNVASDPDNVVLLQFALSIRTLEEVMELKRQWNAT
jgi:hypothetical protein